MSIQDLTNEELNARYIEANEELARRRRIAAIPREISELAQQGREMGIGESTLAEALINAPEPEAEAEAEAEAEPEAEAEAEAEAEPEAEAEAEAEAEPEGE